jgi:predicted GNAT family acetyltransferase
MKEKVRIENLQESNIDDLIHVCSGKKLTDPVHMRGVELKKHWLREMLEKYGSCAKIAFYGEKPVAQILYYPEEADITKASRRKNVLIIQCVYNPMPEAQKRGIGTQLLRSVIQDAKNRKTPLGLSPCRFMLARAFNTGEFLSLTDFYRKNGFLPTPEENLYCLQMEAGYESAKPVGKYKPLPEDKNKAIIFYSPTCQFSYPFALRTSEIIKEVAPQIEIEFVNEWEKAEEAIKRRNQWLVVNSKPIHTFFMDTDRFKTEIRQALS